MGMRINYYSKIALRPKYGDNFPRLGAHQLRHLWAKTQIDKGRDIKAVSNYLGHSTVSTTLDIYHVAELKPEQASIFTEGVA